MTHKPELLAIEGGSPVRAEPFPSRMQFDQDVRRAVDQVFEFYGASGQDFGSQGHFERVYTGAFAEYMGRGGYCDAVCSGTAGLFVALGALNLPERSTVLISAITDPGCVSAVILNRLVPKIVDVAPRSYNISLEQIRSRMDEGVHALVLVHSAGKAVRDVEQIARFCREKRIALVEDCSQAHGASAGGVRVGNFGDVAVFSTMYSKNHSSGGAGGLVFTRSEPLYREVRMRSDRGKPFHSPDFDPKNPEEFLFPALNLPQDEISCAIGAATLKKLEAVRSKRVRLIRHLNARLAAESVSCRGVPVEDGDSPFFWPILFSRGRLSCDKHLFAQALRAEGIPLNPHYRYLVTSWPWVRPHLADGARMVNGEELLESSFNLLFNEKFSDADMDDIVAAVVKVERHFRSDSM